MAKAKDENFVKIPDAGSQIEALSGIACPASGI